MPYVPEFIKRKGYLNLTEFVCMSIWTKRFEKESPHHYYYKSKLSPSFLLITVLSN